MVSYLGIVRQDDTLNILHEFVPNNTLEMLYKKAYAEKGRFSEIIIAKYAESILHGLEFLHQSDVVHGNVKASNVFVKDTG